MPMHEERADEHADRSGAQPTSGPPLQVRLLRYAAVAITALAFVGGAGWLLQRRAKRRRTRQGDASMIADQEDAHMEFE